MFSVPVVNSLWSILSGDKFDIGDCHLNNLLSAIEVFFRTGDLVRSNVAVPSWVLRRFASARRFQGNRTDQLLCVQNFLRVSTTFYSPSFHYYICRQLFQELVGVNELIC